MTVRVYRSTDFAAPVLNGNAGSAITVLDAVLVNGYGDQTITITRAGSIATITTPSPHGLVKLAKYTIAGAAQTEYNGDKSVTVTGANTLTFTVTGSPATPATGTITGRLAGAGWSKPFTGTNKAVFKQGAGSNQMYLRVDDTSGLLARIVGYEVMTTVDAGTNAFPTDAQFAGGLYLPKSSDTTSKPWVIVATEKNLLFYVNANNAADSANGQLCWFGDPLSNKPGDLYHTLIIGGTATNAATSNTFSSTSGSLTTQSGHYFARLFTQLGSSQAAGKLSYVGKAAQNTLGSGNLPYPNGSDNSLHYVPIELCTTNDFRAILPGVWNPCHNKPLTHLDTFDGIGAWAGRTYLVLNVYSSGQVFVEISDTW